LGGVSDKSMEALILAENDEVGKTTLKLSTSSALRKRLGMSLLLILFVDVDIYDYDTKLREFYTIIFTINAFFN
jgi:hypothetical protein